jgi:hypothetical protein
MVCYPKWITVEQKNAKNVALYSSLKQWRILMNSQNEVARNLRCVIENIDKILATEHIDYKKGEELRNKRNQYAEYLKTLIPTLQGVDY